MTKTLKPYPLWPRTHIESSGTRPTGTLKHICIHVHQALVGQHEVQPKILFVTYQTWESWLLYDKQRNLTSISVYRDMFVS